MNLDHPYYLRIHEGLNQLSLLLDETRKELVSSEHSNSPAAANFSTPELSIHQLLQLIGLALLKSTYYTNLQNIDDFQPRYQPAFRLSYNDALAQIDKLISQSNHKTVTIDRLHFILSLDKTECAKDLSHQGRDPDSHRVP